MHLLVKLNIYKIYDLILLPQYVFHSPSQSRKNSITLIKNNSFVHNYIVSIISQWNIIYPSYLGICLNN